MKILNFILILSIIVISDVSLSAQQKLQAINVLSGTRVQLVMSNYPIEYSTQLAQDKRKIIINLTNTSVADTARSKAGSGLISEVYVQSQKKNLSVFVSLQEEHGYTAAPLPYTRSILIDAVRWDNLSTSDDAYYTALLALEDNILESAKRDFLSAAMEKHGEAAMFLGIILLQQGKVNSALKNLEFALNKGVTLPDLFAALSQAYSIKQDKTKSNEFAERFKTSTSMSFSPQLPITTITEPDSAITEPVAHLILDTNEVAKDTIKADTAISQKFEGLFADSTKKADDSFIPGIYNQILIYVAGIALAIILLIVLLYLKWRNKQLLSKNINEKTAKTVPKRPAPRESQASQQAHLQAQKLFAAKAYSKNPVQKENSPAAEKKETQIESKASINHQKNKDELIETILNISKDKQALSKDEYTIPQEKKKPLSAKLEIAMNLAVEQRKIKQKNINSIGSGAIDLSQSKLTDMAKKLGIEKGSLETKKALNKIEKDEAALSKLKNKFKK